MKKIFITLLIAIGCLFIFRNTKAVQIPLNIITTPILIQKTGDSVKTRVLIPKGYERKKYIKGSFQHYLQNYKLKPFGAKIINYDGEPYSFQKGHIGVLELPVTSNGLQQCADALIRIRSEFLWSKNKQNEIGFQFTSGHYCSWKKYAEGYRPKINGNKVSFHKTAKKNTSKENFYKYLDLIYMYSGTLSMYTELIKLKDDDLEVGDMVVTPGTPGHIIMIVDLVENKNGEKLYLLAQGNTPAQSVHVLKNASESTINPWYNLSSNKRLETPIYWFENPKFIRFKP